MGHAQTRKQHKIHACTPAYHALQAFGATALLTDLIVVPFVELFYVCQVKSVT